MAAVPDEALASFMAAHLPVASAPGVPEVRLHQAGPHSGLRRWAERVGSDAPPYWAHAWGGGLVLARFLLDHPEHVVGRSVLDLGSGSGLVAIAAALAGAVSVAARDIDPQAAAATAVNAALNGVVVATICGDLPAGLSKADVDTVLVGDLFYASDLAERVTAGLMDYVAAGLDVLVGDPGRADLPSGHLQRLFSHPTPDFGSVRGVPQLSSVYRFTGGG